MSGILVIFNTGQGKTTRSKVKNGVVKRLIFEVLLPLRVENFVFWERAAQKRCFLDACNRCHFKKEVAAIAG